MKLNCHCEVLARGQCLPADLARSDLIRMDDDWGFLYFRKPPSGDWFLMMFLATFPPEKGLELRFTTFASVKDLDISGDEDGSSCL